VLLGTIAACALLVGFQLAVTLLQPSWSRVVTDWLLMALAWLALLVVGYVAWWSSRARRLASPSWWPMTVALLCYAIARTLWAVEDVFIFPQGVPFPNLPELLFALQYPCFFLAIILVPRRRPATPRAVLLLDFLLWMGAALALSSFFMLAPIITKNDLSPLGKVLALSAPVGDLLVLLGLTVILLRPPNARPAPVFGILIAAVACLIVADTWFTLIILQSPHTYLSGAAPDVFWLACYLLIPLAALVWLRIAQRGRAAGVVRAWSEPDQEDVLWQDIKASLPNILPIVAALLASATLMIGAIVRATEPEGKDEIGAIIMIFGLLLLVIMRQVIMCLDDAHLRREEEVAQAHARALAELNRRKDEFFAVLSHEIRTPLTSVHGYVQLLLHRLDAWQPPADGAGLPAEVVARAVAQARVMLVSCERSLQRLTRLADDLVDDARIRDGQLALRLAPCDLCALVSSAVEEQRAPAPAARPRFMPRFIPSGL